jgi:hypothetical protein
LSQFLAGEACVQEGLLMLALLMPDAESVFLSYGIVTVHGRFLNKKFYTNNQAE